MIDCLYCIDRAEIEKTDEKDNKNIISSLESGKIIYLPKYTFIPSSSEDILLSEHVLDKRSKNISYDYTKKELSGLVKKSNLKLEMQAFMHRYALFSKHLVDVLLSEYSSKIIWGRTSFRPAQISGRASSKRKDDTLVHVDSFPSSPVNGLRIFRIFCNINPYGEPRTWQVGEPFSNLIKKFSHKLPKYSNTKANILNLIGATKSKRSAYDHYMLHMHDMMKLNDDYQTNLQKKQIDFPPKSTWMVFTDQVSHAALSGQFLLEQTFYLPVNAMLRPELSPLKQWEDLDLI